MAILPSLAFAELEFKLLVLYTAALQLLLLSFTGAKTAFAQKYRYKCPAVTSLHRMCARDKVKQLALVQRSVKTAAEAKGATILFLFPSL